MLFVSCKTKTHAEVPLYTLDTGSRIDAIIRGCYQGYLASCSCTTSEPITCVHDEKCPKEEIASALRHWCSVDNYADEQYNTDDIKTNMGYLTQRVCEKYLFAAFVIHRGYDQDRAKLAAKVLCHHRLEWRAER
jgi:hypothetical protein